MTELVNRFTVFTDMFIDELASSELGERASGEFSVWDVYERGYLPEASSYGARLVVRVPCPGRFPRNLTSPFNLFKYDIPTSHVYEAGFGSLTYYYVVEGKAGISSSEETVTTVQVGPGMSLIIEDTSQDTESVTRKEITLIYRGDDVLYIKDLRDENESVAWFWYTPCEVQDFLNEARKHLAVRRQTKVFAAFRSEDYPHFRGTVSAIEEQQHFPQLCQVLRLDTPQYSVSWHDGQLEGKDVNAIAIASYMRDLEVQARLYRATVDANRRYTLEKAMPTIREALQ